MSEGTDGVGNDSSSRDTSASQSQSADALGQAMESFSAGLQGAAGALSQALDNPLGAVADALGLRQAIDQIADCIQRSLRPLGVGVVIDATHECMTTRGIHKRGVSMVTSKMVGSFREDARTRNEFLRFIDVGNGR